MMGDIADTKRQGALVARYRKLKNWSRAELAEKIDVDVSTIYRWEKSSVIKDLHRRQLLVELLGIPAALMGLEGQQQQQTLVAMLTLNDDRMTFFEQEMNIRWDIYQTGGTTRAYRGLDVWLKEVEDFARQTSESGWFERAHAALCMSYQLQGSLLRDLMQYEQAHLSYQKAICLAGELDDPELSASAIARRGVTCIQQKKPMEAIEYLKEAEKLVNGVGLPCLRGYILQALSEAYAMTQQASLCWRHVDLAERALERRGHVLERSNCQANTTSITAQKGVNAVWLHEYTRATSLIEKGLVTYDPTLIRGRARLLAQQAEAYYGQGLIDSSTATATEAWTLARSVGSRKTLARIKQLYASLTTSRWKEENSVKKLGVLIA